MIRFDQKDKTLGNIARVIEERLAKRGREADLTLVLDPSLSELESRFADGVISGGSYADILYVAGKYLRDPKMANGEYKSFKPICGLYWATHNQGYAETAPIEELFEDIEDEALREQMKSSGLGTPATRAATIERLIEVGYARREKKNIVSTQKGRELIAVAPGPIASAATTGKWEKVLSDMAAQPDPALRRQKVERFMSGIRRFAEFLVEAAKG